MAGDGAPSFFELGLALATQEPGLSVLSCQIVDGQDEPQQRLVTKCYVVAQPKLCISFRNRYAW